MIAAIDPGSEKSAIVIWDGISVAHKAILENSELLCMCRDQFLPWKLSAFVCERVECYGMPVGKEVFETVYWSGRFMEASISKGTRFHLIPRREVKLHLCGTMKAKDGNIIQALKDRFGDKGTKKEPGVTFGMNSHLWQAFALATTCHDNPELLK